MGANGGGNESVLLEHLRLMWMGVHGGENSGVNSGVSAVRMQ